MSSLYMRRKILQWNHRSSRALPAALIGVVILTMALGIGCARSGQSPAFNTALLELSLSLNPEVASVGATIGVQHTLTNTGNVPITICRTQNSSLKIGPRQWEVVSAHESCVAANRAKLDSGESVKWIESVSLGSCEENIVEQELFRRKYFVCAGAHPVSAELALFVGARCTRRKPCARRVVTSMPASLQVQ